MNNDETKHITDLSFQLIDAVADISKFPGSNKTAIIAIYKSSVFLYTITINVNDRQFSNLEFLAESRNNDTDYIFRKANDTETIYTLKYLNHDKDDNTHTFLIRPDYQKIDTAELLNKQSLYDTVMKKLINLKKKIMNRKKLLEADKISE
jgi:hypothetical protein